MPLNRTTVSRYLNEGRFEDLFVELLGWDVASTPPLDITIAETTYLLRPIAQKRGLIALELRHSSIPLYALRRKIETQVAKRYREHIIVYVDEAGDQQVWQWVRREQGQPLQSREHIYRRGQSGESLTQKLEYIRFTLEQEDDLSLVDVVGQVRAAFNVERATKKFYREFKKQHDAFQEFLQGIPDADLEDWYVSVMLNRLMFIYFIQKKEFLDEDIDYLRHKLDESEQVGEDRYYQDFLCPLFFEGFAKPESQRDPALRQRLGQVPYLNGGIFQQHQVERLHGETIRLPDQAFRRLFDFFDRYQWHLDDSPLRNDNEINPDVLGYIFEQYINQKQMGAYYTKEDITEYISKNTIIPFLFDRARKHRPAAFQGEDSPWRLLQEDPDRYIYDAVSKGIMWTEDETGAKKVLERPLDLPPEIEAGINDVSKRGKWNTRTPGEYALPTEIWRETVARRQRYEEIWLKLVEGEVQDINELITLNLDIRQFAQDVIEQTEDPDLVRAFWKAATGVTVLDPTCGSGAFLFAALNILYPIYEGCLDRMQQFVDELPPDAPAQKFRDFRETLAEIARHPNREYFILKRIMVDNLYGVDIMEEATEIAKLRLFLKLVAQVEDVARLEPLPDIDFNIRAGNTLVGFTSLAQVEEVVRGDRLLLLSEDEVLLEEISEQAEHIERLFKRFRHMQTAHDVSEWSDDFVNTKTELRRRLAVLEDRLNRLLALQYGVNPEKPQEYGPWVKSHQPFHWFVDFYGIMSQGGFDVITGNPPYVQYSRIRNQYSIKDIRSLDGGNLYVFVMERSTILLSEEGRVGLIVPISFISITDTITIREIMSDVFSVAWMSNFAIRPSKLFEGVEQRLTICLAGRSSTSEGLWQTKYLQWYKAERPILFERLYYGDVTTLARPDFVPKVCDEISLGIIHKITTTHKEPVAKYLDKRRKSTLYFHRTPGYWIRIMDFEPFFRSPTSNRSIHHIRELSVKDQNIAKFIGAFISSSLYFFYFFAMGNCRNLTSADVKSLRIGTPSSDVLYESNILFDQLMEDFKQNSIIKTRGVTEFQEFNWAASKPIIDNIDRVMAKHFGLNEEELDVIVNYDIKIRMGDELFNNSEED